VTFTISDNPNDLVEKKIVQDKLKQSEQHYRLLFENNPLPAWIFDVGSHQFLEVN
jgi:PAS domain-containing protein